MCSATCGKARTRRRQLSPPNNCPGQPGLGSGGRQRSCTSFSPSATSGSLFGMKRLTPFGREHPLFGGGGKGSGRNIKRQHPSSRDINQRLVEDDSNTDSQRIRNTRGNITVAPVAWESGSS